MKLMDCQTLINRIDNMQIISMPLFLVLFLLSGVLCGTSAVESVPKYEHVDPSTGEILTCDKCPPGTHMAAHCTATTPTKCAPCKADHYTELWNYLPRCLYCNNFCFDNQEVEKECSAVNNRVCRCKEGFYKTYDFCMKHSECGTGQGVFTRGTSQMDTVCELCAEGYFSSSSSALDSCVRHQECASGELALLNGTSDQDTLCGTCQNIANGGATSRAFFSGFFGMHRMRVAKMKKFVSRYIRSGQDRRIRDTVLPKQRGPLLDQIKAWLNEASLEQLKKLPEMLRATQLTVMADKLEKRLSEIQQQTSNCTLA
ncbi:tumor necrosis factor receptor superfamily member 6B [Larimichthys crocea]|uniref:tumor necrosis factor receptor superfamily member 6B n=1 Tax=Larimichthys crocea TaxID=215358 RepID=UPI000F5FF6F7|nr:tumor necrosis factor receptor superfamily member 6B [Larimichthys crocea]